jgi:hypothetical protein
MKYQISARIVFVVDADSRAEAYAEGANRLIEADLTEFDLTSLTVGETTTDRPAAKPVPEVLGEFAAAWRDGKSRVVEPVVSATPADDRPLIGQYRDSGGTVDTSGEPDLTTTWPSA